MTKRHHTALEDSLFSLDLKGEGYVPEPEDDVTDWSINIKDKHSKKEPASEKLESIEIPSATYIPALRAIPKTLSAEDEELYRRTVLDVRRFVYNSIVSEEFCVSFEVKKKGAYGPNQLSDVSDVESDPETSTSPAVIQRKVARVSNSPSANTVDEGIYGSRKAQKFNVADSDSSSIASSADLEEHKEHDVSDAPKEVGRKKGAELGLITGLRTKSAVKSEGENAEVVDATDGDSIKLTVNVKKLGNIITDIEHVQLCASVPFPRLFRLARENVSSGLLAAGRRYFLASETAKGYVQSSCHKSFLAHLYRRKRSVCFFCGLLSCSRTISSKQPCDSMRCHRCSFLHKWGKNRCNDGGSMVQYYLKSNDWRNKRRNPWNNVPSKLRNVIRCFYCGKLGDASAKCRPMACPNAASSIEYRCLELLGKGRLDHLVREKPEMFHHLRDPNYVFK